MGQKAKGRKIQPSSRKDWTFLEACEKGMSNIITYKNKNENPANGKE